MKSPSETQARSPRNDFRTLLTNLLTEKATLDSAQQFFQDNGTDFLTELCNSNRSALDDIIHLSADNKASPTLALQVFRLVTDNLKPEQKAKLAQNITSDGFSTLHYAASGNFTLCHEVMGFIEANATDKAGIARHKTNAGFSLLQIAASSDEPYNWQAIADFTTRHLGEKETFALLATPTKSGFNPLHAANKRLQPAMTRSVVATIRHLYQATKDEANLQKIFTTKAMGHYLPTQIDETSGQELPERTREVKHILANARNFCQHPDLVMEPLATNLANSLTDEGKINNGLELMSYAATSDQLVTWQEAVAQLNKHTDEGDRKEIALQRTKAGLSLLQIVANTRNPSNWQEANPLIWQGALQFVNAHTSNAEMKIIARNLSKNRFHLFHHAASSGNRMIWNDAVAFVEGCLGTKVTFTLLASDTSDHFLPLHGANKLIQPEITGAVVATIKQLYAETGDVASLQKIFTTKAQGKYLVKTINKHEAEKFPERTEQVKEILADAQKFYQESLKEQKPEVTPAPPAASKEPEQTPVTTEAKEDAKPVAVKALLQQTIKETEKPPVLPKQAGSFEITFRDFSKPVEETFATKALSKRQERKMENLVKREGFNDNTPAAAPSFTATETQRRKEKPDAPTIIQPEKTKSQAVKDSRCCGDIRGWLGL